MRSSRRAPLAAGTAQSAAPRRARAAVSARTRVQAHLKTDEPTRPIRLSSKHQPDAGPRASERQQPTPPPTDTVRQELHAAPTPPRGCTPLPRARPSSYIPAATRACPLLRRTDQPPRADRLAAVHHVSLLPPQARRAIQGLISEVSFFPVYFISFVETVNISSLWL